MGVSFKGVRLASCPPPRNTEPHTEKRNDWGAIEHPLSSVLVLDSKRVWISTCFLETLRCEAPGAAGVKRQRFTLVLGVTWAECPRAPAPSQPPGPHGRKLGWPAGGDRKLLSAGADSVGRGEGDGLFCRNVKRWVADLPAAWKTSLARPPVPRRRGSGLATGR